MIALNNGRIISETGPNAPFKSPYRQIASNATIGCYTLPRNSASQLKVNSSLNKHDDSRVEQLRIRLTQARLRSKTLRSEIDNVRCAFKIQSSAKCEELQHSISRWRFSSQEVADRVFVVVHNRFVTSCSDEVSRVGSHHFIGFHGHLTIYSPLHLRSC